MNTNEYLDLFLEESREHMQNLNSGLLKLEQNPNDLVSIDEIFRSAHTLKGMSATMGYDKIAELTHKMENLLSLLREGKKLFSPEIGDILFGCVDALEEMVKSVADGKEIVLEIGELVTKLVHLEEGESSDFSFEKNQNQNEFNVYEKNVITKAKTENMHGYRATIEISPDCVMKSVRAFMVFKTIEENGEIIKAFPDAQMIEEEKFDKEFTLIFVDAREKEEISRKLNLISEVKVKKIDLLDLSENEEIPDDFEAEQIANNAETVKPPVLTDARADKGTVQSKSMQTVRVDIGKLDNLMNLVGELVINKTRLEQILKTNDLQSLNETVEQIDRITTDVQNVVMNVRMVPIEQVFNRFPRMVRDLSKGLNKEVKLILEGKETELDRTVIDEIGDPLVHCIRNSIDHGVESPEERVKQGKPAYGTIRLIARQEGDSVIIIIEDDGKGIDVERVKSKVIEKGLASFQELEQMEENAIINYIFAPGFSTAKEITDVSGRGVGLDVARSKIQALRGQIFVESKSGQGSRFIIKLPLTLAIIQALLVKVGSEVYAIPLANIDETTGVEDNQINTVQNQEVMVMRGSVLTLVRLARILEVPDAEKTEEELYVVVVKKGSQRVGLVVSELIGQQEIVITSLGTLLLGTKGIAGAAILGDGRVALILDIGTLF